MEVGVDTGARALAAPAKVRVGRGLGGEIKLTAIVTVPMEVFSGRLEGINARLALDPDIPPVNVDPDHFKRVIVNLVDNAGKKKYFVLIVHRQEHVIRRS